MIYNIVNNASNFTTNAELAANALLIQDGSRMGRMVSYGKILVAIVPWALL